MGVPKVDATKCPKLDCVVKGSVSKETKDADATPDTGSWRSSAHSGVRQEWQAN